MNLNQVKKTVLYIPALLAVAGLLAGCLPSAPTISASDTPTPRVEASPTSTATVAPLPSETPKAPELCGLNPREIAVVGKEVVAPEYSWMDQPLAEWTEDERKMGGDGNLSIFEQVSQLLNTPWVKENALTLAGVGVGQGCGFGAVFKNQEGLIVWATTGQDQVLTGEPSGYGFGEGVYVLPGAGVQGDLKLLVGETRELVVTRTVHDQERVVKWFDQISREWKWTEEISLPANGGTSLEFSELLPAPIWKKTFVGRAETESGNLEIPIIFGVADTQAKKNKIQSVWMTQKGTDALADGILRGYHYRYSEIMGNNITYEDYKKLLAEQEHGGEILMMVTTEDGKYQEELLDPRQGVSILITKNIDSMISTKPEPIRSLFLGVDGKGRLLGATNLYLNLGSILYSDGVVDGSARFVFDNILLIIKIVDYPDKCLVTRNIIGNCGPENKYDNSCYVWQELSKYIGKDAKFGGTGLGLVLK